MTIQSTRITEQTADRAVIEILLADRADAETTSDAFVKFREVIPSAPAPYIAQLQLVALERARARVMAEIEGLRALMRDNHVDIPR